MTYPDPDSKIHAANAMPVPGEWDNINTIDQDGNDHWHEVPKHGQFRLRSACGGCDAVQELYMEDLDRD